MRVRWINYDTGFLSAGTSTREPFDPEEVRRAMRIIRDDLHCTAVRITGGRVDRLEIAAKHAAEAGLEAWLCPFTNGLTQDELLALLADCAERAERLRQHGATVVMLTGSELSLFTVGFFPDGTLFEKLALLTDPVRLRPLIADVRIRLNDFLRRAVDIVRERFAGPVSYASLPLEGVDWTRFDIVATDAAYRSAVTAPQFRESVRAFVAQARALGKPVAATEFGCATYSGAGNVANYIDQTIVWDEHGRAIGLNGEFVRDEQEQATYVRESFEIFTAEGLDAAFAYTFARYDLPHRHAPAIDLDMASAGAVKVFDRNSGRDSSTNTTASDARSRRYPDMPWETKAAFDIVADQYGR